MIIVECDQGGIEWHAARAGVITASMFRTARTKVNCLTDQQAQYVAAVREGIPTKDAAAAAGYKTVPRSDIITRALDGEQVGDYSDAAKDYAFRLAVERVSRTPLDEGFETFAMKRGHELEPVARMEHELKTGLMIERAGFVLTDDKLFGASADGLIGDDGGSEYKCLISPEELRKVLIDGDISKYIDQVQGCMWITGRKYWHFCLYCPALEPIGRQLWWRRIERDDNYIETMEQDLIAFERMVSDIESTLRMQHAA
jgi:hypothetical protein